MARRFLWTGFIAAALVLSVLGALAATRSALAATAATLTVNSAADLIAADGLCTLREAVIAANTNTAFSDCPAGSGADTIVFDGSLPLPITIVLTTTGAGEDAALTGDLDISERLTISGTGRAELIIDGFDDDRVFEVLPATTVTVTGLTIQHGRSDALLDGGGAKVAGTLYAYDALITHNYGGGLFTTGGGLVLYASDVISNTGSYGLKATSSGAIINFTDGVIADNAIGGVYNYQGSVTLVRCTVENNRGFGGLRNLSASGTGLNTPMIVSGCTVRGNTSTSSGAGAYSQGPGARLTINNSSFFSNTAAVGGGGVYNENILNISGSTFAFNQAISGAAVQHIFGTLDIKNSTFSDNTALDNAGAIQTTDSATLLNVTIAGNVSDGDGGGLVVDTAFIILKNSIVADNQSGAALDGNCAFTNGGSLTSQGYNLDTGDSCSFHATGDITGTAAGLGALADNGGPTWTRALLAGSPAIDHATNAGCPATDQRGVPRPLGGVCDMGAFEFGDAANLAIGKRAHAANVALGQPLTYTVWVTNAGPLNAQAITVTDQLPAGVIFGGAAGPDWTCAEAAGTVTCVMPVLTMTTRSFIITATAPSVVGTFTNTAVVTATTYDPNLSNNTATAAVKVFDPTLTDLSIAKSASPSPVLAQRTLTYTLRVTNTGPAAAEFVTVTDWLPPEVTYQGANVTLGWTCTHDSGTVTCTRSSLPVLSDALIITVTAPGGAGVITNTAAITSTSADANPANNAATVATLVVLPQANLAIHKAAPATVQPFAALTYTLRMTNTGPQAASAVTVTDQLPAGVSVNGASGSGWSCDLALETLTCTRDTFAVGNSTVIITATAPGSGIFTNTVAITSATFDPAGGNNFSSAVTVVDEPQADLALAKFAPSGVVINAPLTYTFIITNSGPQAASALTLTDHLPAGVIYGGASGPDWLCAAEADVVTCERATLAVGSSTLIITATAPASAGLITNTATITATTVDPVENNNAATATTTIFDLTSADLQIDPQPSASPVMADSVLTYSLAAINWGPGTAGTVTVTHVLPPEVAFGDVSAIGWGCDHAAGIITCTRSAFAPNTDLITVTVTVPDMVGVLISQTEIGGDVPDPDMGNNAVTLSVPVVRPRLYLPWLANNGGSVEPAP